MSSAAPVSNLGKYEIRGTLRKGATGTVYDGWDPVIHRRVVIKTIRRPEPDDLDAGERMARFKREAQAAGRLNHPNIVSLFDYGEMDELAYMVMEFVDGPTLKDMLSGPSCLPAATAVSLMEGVLDALAFCHGRGVVHQDLTPANVRVTADGQAKIDGFGILRIEGSNMAQAGTMMGAPAYMSPEQIMGQVVDQRTDIYVCGVMLYQLLTGERPFAGSTASLMHEVPRVTLPRPSEPVATSPPALDSVVAKAMAWRPEDRFASAADFSQALRASLPFAPVAAFEDAEVTLAPHQAAMLDGLETIPPRAAKPPSKLPLLAVAAGAMAVALAVAVWAFKPAGELVPRRQASLSWPEPKQAPVPAPSATSATLVEAALAASLPTIRCSLVRAAVRPDGSVAMSGVAGAGPPQDAVQNAVTKARPSRSDGQVQRFDGPYCPALDILRTQDTAGRAQDAASIDRAGGPAGLHDNDVIALQVTMPNFAGYLHVMYVQHDETVAPLVPGAGYPSQVYAARSRIALGNPRADYEGWRVGPPFGTDMIVAVATTAPLFGRPLPANEQMGSYLRSLQAAITALRQRGGSVSAAAIVLETLPTR